VNFKAGPDQDHFGPKAGKRRKARQRKGWNKKQIATFISQYARIPANRDVGIYGPLLVLPPKEYTAMYPDDTMPLLPIPEWIRIIVAGGPGNFMGIHQSSYPAPGIEWVTRKIKLPKNWAQLVKKYKDLVPNYVRY